MPHLDVSQACSLALLPGLCSLALYCPSQQAGSCWPGKTGHKVVLVPAVPLLAAVSLGHHHPECMDIKKMASIFLILPYFQNFTSRQNTHALLSRSISSGDQFFFLQTFLFYLLFLLEPQAQIVSNLNSPYAEVEHVISLIFSDSVSCHFIFRLCHFRFHLMI